MIGDFFNNASELFEDEREICSPMFGLSFDNPAAALKDGNDYYNNMLNETIVERNKIEQYYYERIRNGLMSKLIEIKSYSNVSIFDTRRWITTNDDCISSVQILIRDKIFINIFMRSSDFDGALSSDLKFFSSLPTWLINQLINMKDDYRFNEVTDESINTLNNMGVDINIMFGSLHRTN